MLKGLHKARPAQVAHCGDLSTALSRSGPPGQAVASLSQADSRGERSFPPSHVCDSRTSLKTRFFSTLLALFWAFQTALAAPPGAVISNQASLEYRDTLNQPVTELSNLVELTTAVVRSPATVEFTRVVPAGGTWQETVGPSACWQGGAFVTLGDPTLIGGNVIDPTLPQDTSATEAYNLGEALFLRLVDADQNVDFQVQDYAVVTVSVAASGDSETVRLAETGLDTGVFTGYLPTAGGTAAAGDCVLQAAPQSSVMVDYVDPADATDTAQDSASFDPVQRVFESRTGTAISGATIEIVDAVTGLPATVYGNDGVSQFPAAITSGGTTVDSGGTAYVFGPGEYRFPVVPDGDYRLVVTPPPEYSAPSSADPTSLQALPGAPYALGPGSFGQAFTKAGDLSIAVDIPVDPRASALFLRKSTLTTTAAPGDFVRYELELENASVTGIATDIRIVDDLPAGMRYVEGSARVSDTSTADPVVSADGRQLDFTLTDLDVSERVRLSYVAEVIGGRRNDELVNRATAFAGGGLISNEATAMIRLTEDLLRSTGTIVGRVIEGDCSQQTFSEDQGVADIRVYVEDGRYAVTDEGGRFHFEGVEPGTHVAQLDTFTVPEWFDVIGCADAPAYAGRADSQFVRMTPGSMLRADFYLRRKPAPEGRVDVELISRGTDSADAVGYDLTLNGFGNVAIRNIDVMILLPDGVSYQPGSMRVDGQNLGDPRVAGQVLSLALDDARGNWNSQIAFEADIGSDVSGELATRAVVRFDTPMEAGQQTPPAETIMVREPATVENAGYVLDLKFAILSDELSEEDRRKLDALIEDWRGVRDIRISAVGHSDSQPIAPRNTHLFADNYVLSRARANSAVAYIAAALDVNVDALQVAGRGPDEPVADNASAAGRARNRRVELVMSGLRPSRPSFLEVTKASSGTQATDTQGAVPGTEIDDSSADDDDPSLREVEPPIETLQPGVAMLLPTRGFQPAIAATKISIQHGPGQTVALWINDSPVSNLNFDSTAQNTNGSVIISRWEGVDLVEGPNVIRAVVSDANGQGAETVTRTIHYSGQPIRGEIVPEQSVLVADGKTRPVIAVRLFDRTGRPSRRGMVGGFRIDAPYRSWWEVDNERQNDLVQIGRRAPTYRIGPDGVALIELEPTTRTGEVTLHLEFENYREQEIRTWLSPADRDWILVGFAEGTAAYNTLSDNVVEAEAAGFEEEYSDDGRVAFFAKGRIRGEYLLTLAYDSERERDENAFETVIDPNRYYALYADASEQRFEAPSQRNLYVKLERQQFYALFGDFETGLSVTDLARYERRFNGIQAEYRGENVGYTAFAAETSQAFNRDEIRGDGTSGLYRLSNTPVIANSEQVRIEVRDRFDSGRVLESTTLTRFLDYNLDVLDGTLYFKKPVPSRDLNFNPVYIVVEYESRTTGVEDVIAGGRASIRSSDDRVEVGVTFVDDQTQGSESDLGGVDFRWQVDDQTLVTAEIATTHTTTSGVESTGSAHSVELEHASENVDVRAFIREVDDNFGLGYQAAADSGFRRLGLDLRARVGEHLFVEGEAGWQQNLETEDIRNVARAQLRYERSNFSGTLGLSYAEDKYEDGDNRSSEQAEFGLSRRLFGGRVNLRATATTSLGDDSEILDYPSSVVLGADYRIAEGIDLIAEYEDAEGRDADSTMSRLGIRATPWSRAELNSSLTNEIGEFGPRLFANVGLVQGFQLNERWVLDIGLDQTNTLDTGTGREFDPDRERASGSLNEDFLALHTGAMYTADDWSANSRIEYRNGDSEERTSLLFGWYRQPTSGHGLSAGLTMFRAEGIDGRELTNADLRFGWAWRPSNSEWSFLNRLDLVYDDLVNTTTDESSWRVINNFNANRRISASTQLSLQYAFKYVSSNFDGNDFSGYTDLIGFDVRRGLGSRWDAGINTSVYQSRSSDILEYGAGLDVGYNLATNVWLTLGYNFIGFRDDDFAAARYTVEGPYLRFSIKADQHTLKSIAGQR